MWMPELAKEPGIDQDMADMVADEINMLSKELSELEQKLKALVEKLGIGKNSARVLKTSPRKNSAKKSEKLGKH
jgi:cell division septum initiation protein DivIVA